ncbi:MAG: hypothetical protein R2854_18820 [Caldilineaceae bacterium]
MARGAAYAQDIRRIVQEVEGQGRGIRGFIAESLLGCGGQIVLPDGYLAEAYAPRAGGGVTIADEVQVGFGRGQPLLGLGDAGRGAARHT